MTGVRPKPIDMSAALECANEHEAQAALMCANHPQYALTPRKIESAIQGGMVGTLAEMYHTDPILIYRLARRWVDDM